MTDTKPSNAERVAEQTRIRRKLLENGYTPLANLDKRCLLPGWPTLDVDADQIETWAGQLRYQATGIRVEHGLVVLDFDVDDARALDAILVSLPESVVDVLEAMPQRHGRGAKLALFGRLPDGAKPRDMRSGGYSRPGETTTHHLEVWTGERPRQVGAFGAHTVEAGEIVTRYRWHDASLLDVPLRQLPVVTHEQIDAIITIVNVTLDRLGWTHDAAAALAARSAGEHVFDLHEGMLFDTQEHGALSRDDLEALCAALGESARLSASFADAAAQNPTRCLASIAHDRRLNIHDFMHARNHRPAELKPREITPMTAARLHELAKKGVQQ